MKNEESLIIPEEWYQKGIFSTFFSVLGLFIPVPSPYRPFTPLGFKVGNQWFGFMMCIGVIPFGWIMIIVALIVKLI